MMDDNNTGLRKRVTLSTSHNDTTAAEATSGANGVSNGHSPQASGTTGSSLTKNGQEGSSHRLLGFVLVILHILGVAIFASGFFFRVQLHTGEECDMTYSMRVFLEIQTPFEPSSVPSASTTTTTTTTRTTSDDNPQQPQHHYKLYKFVDRRDPRYQKLLKAPQPLKQNDFWCDGKETATTTRQIVLYIPGHWGSYSQARSVGAHGTQMTGQRMRVESIQRALASDLWSGDADELEHFAYDVFSVDFAEQGGAFHGEFLRLQSDYVAHVVQYIASTCDVSSITLVGHSMGGIVARLTPIRHPATARLLPNIITLATPHANPLYAFDKSVRDVFQQVEEETTTNSTLIVSVSSGLRDEMIEPSASYLGDERPWAVSILSPELLPQGAFGMDHRAIVWCHGVLDQVRKVIWTLALSSSDENVAIRRRKVQEATLLGSHPSFLKDLAKMNTKYDQTYGFWKGLSMESAMLYNLPVLLGVFAFVGGLRLAYPDRTVMTSIAILLCACIFGLIICETSKAASLVLCLVANTVNFCLAWILPVGRFHASRTRLIGSLLGLFGLVQSLAFGYSRIVTGGWTPQPADCVVYIFCVGMMYWTLTWLVGVSETSCSSVAAYVALAALILPVTVAGPITLMAWEEHTRKESWTSLLSMLLSVGMVCFLKAKWPEQQDIPRRWGKVRSACIVGAVVLLSPWLLSRGNGYLLGRLLYVLSWVEIVFSVLEALKP